MLARRRVAWVARPFLREPAPATDRLDEPGELERRRLELAEERDRALAALKELEFDHRTGKVSDEDYRGARRAAAAPGRRDAACARGPHAREKQRARAGREPVRSTR